MVRAKMGDHALAADLYRQALEFVTDPSRRDDYEAVDDFYREQIDGPFADDLMAGVLSDVLPDPATAGFALHVLGDFDAKGESYVYAGPNAHPSTGGAPNRLQRIDVASGAIAAVTNDRRFAATQSPDGRTVYTTFTIARVKRYLITNFAERPRLRCEREQESPIAQVSTHRCDQERLGCKERRNAKPHEMQRCRPAGANPARSKPQPGRPEASLATPHQ